MLRSANGLRARRTSSPTDRGAKNRGFVKFCEVVPRQPCGRRKGWNRRIGQRLAGSRTQPDTGREPLACLSFGAFGALLALRETLPESRPHSAFFLLSCPATNIRKKTPQAPQATYAALFPSSSRFLFANFSSKSYRGSAPTSTYWPRHKKPRPFALLGFGRMRVTFPSLAI